MGSWESFDAPSLMDSVSYFISEIAQTGPIGYREAMDIAKEEFDG